MEELVVLVALSDGEVGIVVDTREITEVDKVEFATELASEVIACSLS